MYIKKFIFLLLFLISLSGCKDAMDKDKVYNFVGDSIVARWPLDETFPSQMVYNYGRSGAGISYIKEMNNRFPGQDIVVIIGTNDITSLTGENIENYTKSYMNDISHVSDRKKYLFSVLPRQFENDPKDINDRIIDFNSRIQKLLPEYPDIVYIDVFEDFMDKDHINYQYYSDGLHLNIYGYEILSSKLLKIIY